MSIVSLFKSVNKIFFYSAFFMVSFSCSEFVDVDLSGAKVTSSVVFEDDNTATSAIIGLYYDLSSSGIGKGNINSLSRLASLSADEVYDFGRNPDCVEFQENRLRAVNPYIGVLWNALYKVIYDANLILDGLGKSNTVTAEVKNQLLGEALFVRAFCNFYLVNFFGDVPMVVSTDYSVNSSIKRSSVESVYDLIIADLIKAQSKMKINYVGGNRTRANARTASALLSKVYLFKRDWAKAEEFSTLVIEDSQFQIVQDLREVFLVGSPEAIWQIAPPDPLNVTDEASGYVIVGTPGNLVLRNEFVDSFNENDFRLASWIGTTTTESGNVYYPHKYTLQESGLAIKEYSAIIRLAEMFLIRAEARARRHNLGGAISDLDTVRTRAGRPALQDENPGIEQDDLFFLIEEERKFELFTEWGNRWLDLKRTGKVTEMLLPLKPDFMAEDELYPLPALERERNPSLGNQNPGY